MLKIFFYTKIFFEYLILHDNDEAHITNVNKTNL